MLTRREALKEILEYLRRRKIKEPEYQTEHFEDEVGLDEDGIVIRPPNRKRKSNPNELRERRRLYQGH